jgi:hypothetical protein
MPNPKPRKEFLVPKPRADKTKGKLSKKVVAVKLTEEVDDVVRSLPSMTAWLRRVITEAAQRELMSSSDTNATQ